MPTEKTLIAKKTEEGITTIANMAIAVNLKLKPPAKTEKSKPNYPYYPSSSKPPKK